MWVVQVVLKGTLLVLKENGTLCVLKNGIGQWIASRNLFGNLFVKIALRAFGFPKAAFEIKAIAQDTIWFNTTLDSLLRYEHPLHMMGCFVQEVKKGCSDSQFIVCAAFVVLQLLVVTV